jgi:hypothetical protein
VTLDTAVKLLGSTSGLLLIGLIAVWRAWASERAEVKRLNERYIEFLLNTLTGSKR